MKLPKMVLMTKKSTDMSDQNITIKKVVQWIDKNRIIHTKEDIIRGYVYGGKAIPVSGNLCLTAKSILSYIDSDDRCLQYADCR